MHTRRRVRPVTPVIALCLLAVFTLLGAAPATATPLPAAGDGHGGEITVGRDWAYPWSACDADGNGEPERGTLPAQSDGQDRVYALRSSGLVASAWLPEGQPNVSDEIQTKQAWLSICGTFTSADGSSGPTCMDAVSHDSVGSMMIETYPEERSRRYALSSLEVVKSPVHANGGMLTISGEYERVPLVDEPVPDERGSFEALARWADANQVCTPPPVTSGGLNHARSGQVRVYWTLNPAL